MKIEIKCYRVTQKNEDNINISIYDQRTGCSYYVRFLTDNEESRLFFNEKRCEPIYGKYNNKFPVSDMYMDDIPLIDVKDGKYGSKMSMLYEVQEVRAIDDINVGDYVFTIEKI